ncbi:type II toxin-antitoxin system RelE/ParE family toxin [Agrobacterium sp. rho-13.3]|uniref:type II toxin-antitoxin system RelE/ParE family toxin n=1 Tax=Agrobacterium sp. rho-13.3 TaxID=3072980 RepID=UPI0039B78C8B
MKRYVLSPKARCDLNLIWDYAEETWGVAQAEVYLASIQKTLIGLCDRTVISQSANHIRENYRKISVGSHIIFFKENNDIVEVVRILHQRMHTSRL